MLRYVKFYYEVENVNNVIFSFVYGKIHTSLKLNDQIKICSESAFDIFGAMKMLIRLIFLACNLYKSGNPNENI